MSVQIYHPNKANKGYASSFWKSEKDGTIFATLLKQAGWDAKRSIGLFKDNIDNKEGRVNIKLSNFEVCAILDCIERNRAFSTFHDSDEYPKQISFSPHERGYSFTINVKNKQDSSYQNAFFILFTFAEARMVREFLIWSLHNHFDKTKITKRDYTKEQVYEAGVDLDDISTPPTDKEQSDQDQEPNTSNVVADSNNDDDDLLNF